MNSLECIQNYFKMDAKFDREPVKLLQDWGDVVGRRSPSNNTGSRVLDTLELVDRFLCKAK